MDKIIVVHESKTDSIVKDIFTFGSMIVMLSINHLFLGGRLALDLFFLGMIIAYLLAKGSPATESFTSIQDARAYLIALEVRKSHEND